MFVEQDAALGMGAGPFQKTVMYNAISSMLSMVVNGMASLCLCGISACFHYD